MHEMEAGVVGRLAVMAFRCTVRFNLGLHKFVSEALGVEELYAASDNRFWDKTKTDLEPKRNLTLNQNEHWVWAQKKTDFEKQRRVILSQKKKLTRRTIAWPSYLDQSHKPLLMTASGSSSNEKPRQSYHSVPKWHYISGHSARQILQKCATAKLARVL